MGAHASAPERPAGATAIGGAMRRCLCPARCPYAAAHRPARLRAETLARALIDLLPGDPLLALELVADLGAVPGG